MESDLARPNIPAMNVTGSRMPPSQAQLQRLELKSSEYRTLIALGLIGAVIAAVGMQKGTDGFWASWLLVAYYALGLSLSGLCFVAIHYTTGASWSVAIRRVAEAFAEAIPVAMVLLA